MYHFRICVVELLFAAEYTLSFYFAKKSTTLSFHLSGSFSQRFSCPLFSYATNFFEEGMFLNSSLISVMTLSFLPHYNSTGHLIFFTNSPDFMANAPKPLMAPPQKINKPARGSAGGLAIFISPSTLAGRTQQASPKLFFQALNDSRQQLS